MKFADGDWKAFVIRSLTHGVTLAVCVIGAMHVAHAWEGRAGVEARSFFTVAGTLAGVPASPTPTLRFTFHKAGEMTPCPPIDAVMVTYNGTTFSAQVPYEACGRGYFDGANITVDVAVNGTSVVVGQAVNPVPYAQFASVAGTANVATQYGTPDCPVGYMRATDAVFTGDMRLCQKRRSDGMIYDEVVRVGAGASAFWIDRYEASVWTTANATSGTQTFQRGEDFNMVQFPRNGQGPGPAYALSVVNVTPANSITWFQANEACSSSGKRLPTGSEWLRAARGTVDPSDPESGNSGCRTSNVDPMFRDRARTTGLGAANCRSFAGAQDMIGNLWEWTDEWYGGAGNAQTVDFTGVQLVDGGVRPVLSAGRVFQGVTNWPDTTGDMTSNFNNYVNRSDGTHVSGLPAAAARGGDWGGGRQAGVLAVYIDEAPSAWRSFTGFRCVIPR